MFNIYNLSVWSGKSDLEENTNNFRLKTSILQLFGGFSKVHMLENVQRSLKGHYTIDENKFKEIKYFEKELIKLEESLDPNSGTFISSIKNLFTKTIDHLDWSNKIIENVSQIIIDKHPDPIWSDFNDSDLMLSGEGISQLNKKSELNFTQNDAISLKDSFQDFKNNYKFNILLIYLLSLEKIIILIYDKIKININVENNNIKYLNQLEKILLYSIINYFKIVYEFNTIVNSNNLQLNFPLNLPNPWSEKDKLCLCDHINNKTNSFNLLFTGFIIDYNLYPLSDLKDFCMNYCLSTNSLKNNKSSTNLKINTTTFKDQKRNFSTTIIKNNNESSQDKDLNYNKSIFSILEKIKELTKNKDYNPRKVQLAIENIWTDISKEKYKLNIYRAIQDLQPHIYEVFILNDPSLLKRVFPNLYLFLDDVRIYLITYNVITTYFRRSSRTTICTFVADQILFCIFKTYFLPIIQDESKGKRVVNRKLTDLTKKEFTKENIFETLSKTKRVRLEKLIESPQLTQESFINKNTNESGLTLIKKILILKF